MNFKKGVCDKNKDVTSQKEQPKLSRKKLVFAPRKFRISTPRKGKQRQKKGFVNTVNENKNPNSSLKPLVLLQAVDDFKSFKVENKVSEIGLNDCDLKSNESLVKGSSLGNFEKESSDLNLCCDSTKMSNKFVNQNDDFKSAKIQDEEKITALVDGNDNIISTDSAITAVVKEDKFQNEKKSDDTDVQKDQKLQKEFIICEKKSCDNLNQHTDDSSCLETKEKVAMFDKTSMVIENQKNICSIEQNKSENGNIAVEPNFPSKNIELLSNENDSKENAFESEKKNDHSHFATLKCVDPSDVVRDLHVIPYEEVIHKNLKTSLIQIVENKLSISESKHESEIRNEFHSQENDLNETVKENADFNSGVVVMDFIVTSVDGNEAIESVQNNIDNNFSDSKVATQILENDIFLSPEYSESDFNLQSASNNIGSNENEIVLAVIEEANICRELNAFRPRIISNEKIDSVLTKNLLDKKKFSNNERSNMSKCYNNLTFTMINIDKIF